jgi:hypothetical protein
VQVGFSASSVLLVNPELVQLYVHEHIASCTASVIKQPTSRYTHDSYRQDSGKQSIRFGCLQVGLHSNRVLLVNPEMILLYVHEHIVSGTATNTEQAAWRYAYDSYQ